MVVEKQEKKEDKKTEVKSEDNTTFIDRVKNL